MYKLDFESDDSLWETCVEAMDKYHQPISWLLSSHSEEFEPRVSWLRFRAELIHRGRYRFLNELEQLERSMVTDKIERELYDCYNSGDKEGLEVCVKTLNGIIAKSKLGLSKLDSDRKLAEAGLKAKVVESELTRYDTEELLAMLEATNNGSNNS